MRVNTSNQPTEASVSELRQLLVQVFHALKERATNAHADELWPLKEKFAEAGLAGRHTRLLLTLGATGPLSVGELAARMDLTSATTSLLAGELERAGFLERREDNDDRRRTILSLPKRLQTPLAALADASVEPLRRTLEQLEPGARKHFLAGLRLLAAETARGKED